MTARFETSPSDEGIPVFNHPTYDVSTAQQTVPLTSGAIPETGIRVRLSGRDGHFVAVSAVNCNVFVVLCCVALCCVVLCCVHTHMCVLCACESSRVNAAIALLISLSLSLSLSPSLSFNTCAADVPYIGCGDIYVCACECIDEC
jgi:hypothetical protein